ncbi:MAG: SPOR domain-containing protein [Desulfobacterales bacterium]
MARSSGESGKKPFLSLSRAAVFSWAAGLFLVSAWMFVLGVMVGRGTVPIEFDVERLKRAVAAAARGAAAEKPPPPARAEMKSKADLGFYDQLPRGPEEKPALPRPAPPEKPRAPEPGAGEVPRAAETEKKPPPPPPSPAMQPPAGAGRTFTVQVAAVRSEEEARGLAARLRQRGYAAYVEPVPSAAGEKIFRVRMGEYPTRDFARSLVERLRRDGFSAEAVAK